MTTPGAILFDPELLQRHSIIRRTPAWKDVAASMARLRVLQRNSSPYDQMDLDREDVLSFYSNLRSASDSIARSICLAAHLARFSKSQAFAHRLNEGFQALSSGLDLASFTDDDTGTELQRCAQAAFPDLNLQFPPLAASMLPADAPAQPSAAPEGAPANAAAAAAGQQTAASPQPEAPPPPPADPTHADGASAEARQQNAASSQPQAPPPPAADPTHADAAATEAEEQHPSSPQTQAPPPPPADPTHADAAAAAAGEQNPAPSQPQAPPPPPADPWRSAVEAALLKIALMERPQMEDVIKGANEGWQNRLVGLLTSQPEISPDIDYLRCRAANHPLGMVLRGRLKNVSLREWNEVYMAGMSATGAPISVPLWFAAAALGALGFDVPRDFLPSDPKESAEVSNFTSKFPSASPRKGIAVIRLTADSQTAEWKINPSMPALILTPEEALRTAKVSPQKYFQDRLHGILIEVARGETPAAARNRAGMNRLNELFPNIRSGLLMLERTGGPDDLASAAVKPPDAYDAYVQAFASSTTTPPPRPATTKAA